MFAASINQTDCDWGMQLMPLSQTKLDRGLHKLFGVHSCLFNPKLIRSNLLWGYESIFGLKLRSHFINQDLQELGCFAIFLPC